MSLGRRHIAGSRDQVSALDRIDGYHDVRLNADPTLLCQGNFTEESGASAMAELLDRRPDVNGVFVSILRAGDVTSGFVKRSHFVRSICDRREGEEALTHSADPLHLALVFGIDEKTAIRYADSARALLGEAAEQASP